MHYKNFLFAVSLAITTFAIGQEIAYPPFLEADPSWGSEIIPFPVDWAPGMTLTGYEELLFAPNWSDPESADFWSLVMGWRIISDQKLEVTAIKDHLRYYFSGLMKPNHWASEFPDPVVTLKKVDKQIFEGSMDVFDGFHTGTQITLHLRATQTYDAICKRFIILIRMSPKGFDQEIWQRLDEITIKPNLLSSVPKG